MSATFKPIDGSVTLSGPNSDAYMRLSAAVTREAVCSAESERARAAYEQAEAAMVKAREDHTKARAELHTASRAFEKTLL